MSPAPPTLRRSPKRSPRPDIASAQPRQRRDDRLLDQARENQPNEFHAPSDSARAPREANRSAARVSAVGLYRTPSFENLTATWKTRRYWVYTEHSGSKGPIAWRRVVGSVPLCGPVRFPGPFQLRLVLPLVLVALRLGVRGAAASRHAGSSSLRVVTSPWDSYRLRSSPGNETAARPGGGRSGGRRQRGVKNGR